MHGRNLPIHLLAVLPGGTLCPVVVAAGLRLRVTGIRSTAPGCGVLLAAKAVHGIGIAEPLTVLALDDNGVVLAIHRLLPGRSWRHREATWMLEVPQAEQPRVGSLVRLYRRRNYTPAHERR